MCYDNNARPPYPPISGGAADGQDVVLTAADGNRFSAYIAYAEKPIGAQILIYPDIRGLHPFYKDLALRFAEIGVRAMAIDYFGRTAGTTTGREDTFDWQTHVGQMTIPTFLTDVTAALGYLNSLSNPQPMTFVVGFCMGGSLCLHTSAEPFNLAGIIPFYSGMTRAFAGAQGTTLEQASKARYPILGLYGGADPGIPPSDLEKLEAQLTHAGVTHEIVSYPGAPHSFFDRKYAEFANESADAWTRMIQFIHTNTKK